MSNQSQEISQTNHSPTTDNRMQHNNLQNLYDKILQLPASLREPMLDFAALQVGVQESWRPSNQGTAAHLNQGNDTFPNGFDDGTLMWRIDNVREKMGKQILWFIP